MLFITRPVCGSGDGTVTGDIAFGDAFYFYTDGAPHDLAVHRPNEISGACG
ncbi:hypothetical protein M0D69_40020 [Caballeronia sp. SEWSISQ10-4 2]|uniref:hypothetical protein n=1 Tax=Caballeronia sp. SEWSISQ10-4 2 TaxID=2937438 RepID=UPI00264EF737|nr:hypothetical protein [Caballeronia sp. SEWSISQ10-4 2]MDN7184096.1 hypothetical protein [Caballeronia sp. SEWSISQ10-4 2]